jgi:hypothetical protein
LEIRIRTQASGAQSRRQEEEKGNEHLDSLFHYLAGRMAWRVHRVSRRFGADSPAVGVRDYFPYSAFRYGQKDRLSGSNPLMSMKAKPISRATLHIQELP